MSIATPGGLGAALRAALRRALDRTLPPADMVEFQAPCPSCGDDASWVESRVETRLRIRIICWHDADTDRVLPA